MCIITALDLSTVQAPKAAFSDIPGFPKLVMSFGIQSLTRDGNRFSIFTRDFPARLHIFDPLIQKKKVVLFLEATDLKPMVSDYYFVSCQFITPLVWV